MELLKTELHCHNNFSNFHVSGFDTPYDCNIAIKDQIEQAYNMGLDTFFITNHNTIEGYEQLLKYKKDHTKYKDMQILPAEEITTIDGSHVIAYGIHKVIEHSMTFEETIDEIKRQDAVSSAPHPFSLLDALREKAKYCDLIEVFNSNNVDVLANTRASIFTQENNMTGVAGSDSHVLSTIGRCTNVIESENNLDDILFAMRHGKIKIENTGYATAHETIEHLRYKIDNSSEFIQDYMTQFYPKSKKMFSLLLKLFEKNPNSYLWILFYKFAIFAMRRISNKINFQNFDPLLIKERDIGTMLRMAL